MADIIQLLPDSIANQIAAGEVIQRPASVVKELLENAIDAGSTHIRLLVKEAGKTLIQVIDNGCGMTETDARMSLERHATSKIRKAEDLFAIRTMGFRGEAMASIAAIAQMELKTRRMEDELGTKILVEASKVKTQESCQCSQGTSISVKNLFFNVPARRNFLKSNSRELKHILDEFQRVAIANPDIFFSLHHNENEMFHLPAGNLRQRIVSIFGAGHNKKLVPVGEDTDALKLRGYVGKPEFAKKTRGEQLFFVNNRFIKSNYLNHAIMSAYEGVLAKDTFPLYVIFMEIDPARIDINVHPTKQEIKFDDERLVYNYLKVAVRHALGQYSITPTLDFDQEVSFSKQFQNQVPIPPQPQKSEKLVLQSKANDDDPRHESNKKNWEKMFEGIKDFDQADEEKSFTIGSNWSDDNEQTLDDESGSFSKSQKKPSQIHNRYIVSHIKSGFMLIDQQSAHERIRYEHYYKAMGMGKMATQQIMFPINLELPVVDAEILKEILPEVNNLGFDIREFGADSFVIHGSPADVKAGKEQQIIESILEQHKQNINLKVDLRESLAKSLALSTSIQRGQELNAIEMQELIDQLFACEVPYKSPTGSSCFITFELDELIKRFNP